MEKEILISDITAKLEEYQEEYRSKGSRTMVGDDLFLFVDYFTKKLTTCGKTITPLGFYVEYISAIHSLEKKVNALEQNTPAAPYIPVSRLSLMRLYFPDITKKVCPPEFSEKAIDLSKGKALSK